jgi:nucleotide-binding universal stress UspA family protein
MMRILLCVAGLPYAERTIQLGGAIARTNCALITMLHIVPSERERPDGEATLATARKKLPDLEVTTRVRRGDPAGRILAEIREGKYNLVIIGANQSTRLRHQLLGSVALQVVRRAPISVLIVRPTWKELCCILICTGGAEVARPVIEGGAWLARAVNAQATLLHVSNPVPSMYTGLGEFEETLVELLKTDTPVARHLRAGAEILNRYQVPAELKLRHGVAVDEILYEAQEGQYDLAVIGAAGATGPLRKWLLGNVTQQIAECAPCSVLIVKYSDSPRYNLLPGEPD